jgi:hypothetical protein
VFRRYDRVMLADADLAKVAAPACLDWTERRPHLAGGLGAALAERIIELGWVARLPDTRAVLVTEDGARQLRQAFAVELGP